MHIINTIGAVYLTFIKIVKRTLKEKEHPFLSRAIFFMVKMDMHFPFSLMSTNRASRLEANQSWWILKGKEDPERGEKGEKWGKWKGKNIKDVSGMTHRSHFLDCGIAPCYARHSYLEKVQKATQDLNQSSKKCSWEAAVVGLCDGAISCLGGEWPG